VTDLAHCPCIRLEQWSSQYGLQSSSIIFLEVQILRPWNKAPSSEILGLQPSYLFFFFQTLQVILMPTENHLARVLTNSEWPAVSLVCPSHSSSSSLLYLGVFARAVHPFLDYAFLILSQGHYMDRAHEIRCNLSWFT
jgi:hypothetical protein